MPMSDIGNECWNERSDVRTEVLRRLEAVIKEKTGRDTVPPGFWAFCQVADVSKLERIIALVEPIQDHGLLDLILDPIIKNCDILIARWLQNISVTKSSVSSTNHSQRSNTAISDCKKRDNQRCVLTGQAEPDVAYIYPYCLIKASVREPTAVERFWDIMKLFWEHSRVEQWKKEIFGDELDLQNPRDTCINMLSLSKHPHAMWEASHFALRPMEKPDPKTLKVQFYWQRKLLDGKIKIKLLTEPKSTRGLYGDQRYPFSIPTGTYKDNGEPEYKAVVSGDTFTLTTPNPDRLPLPSWSLLEMQWHLQRIAAMSGIEAPVYPYPDDDSDGKDTTIDRDTAVRRVENILTWLQTTTDNDESPPEWTFQQSPIEAHQTKGPLGAR